MPRRQLIDSINSRIIFFFVSGALLLFSVPCSGQSFDYELDNSLLQELAGAVSEDRIGAQEAEAIVLFFEAITTNEDRCYRSRGAGEACTCGGDTCTIGGQSVSCSFTGKVGNINYYNCMNVVDAS